MTKYLSFFKVRFITGLQYRTAAYAGVITQFLWGFMEILLFRAFYRANADAFPMSFDALVSYTWMQQAFLALFMLWFWENELFDSIQNGNITYELCRPASLYGMWFSRSLATRLSKTVLRCFPVLFIAAILPQPYRLILPSDIHTAFLFLLSMILGMLVVAAFCMVIYMSAFFTLNSIGLRMVMQSLGDFLSGAIIPLPFLPDKLRQIVELLPFASMQNAPLRIYSGDISGSNAYFTIALQMFWLFLLVGTGKYLEQKGIKNVIVQGG